MVGGVVGGVLRSVELGFVCCWKEFVKFCFDFCLCVLCWDVENEAMVGNEQRGRCQGKPSNKARGRGQCTQVDME